MEIYLWTCLLLSLSSLGESFTRPRITSSSHKLFTVRETDRTQFDLSPRYLTAEVGRTVSLSCRAEGQVSWNFSAPRPQVEISDNELSITNTKFSDTGGYYCRSGIICSGEESRVVLAGLLTGT